MSCGVVLAYGVSFLSGLITFLVGLTPLAAQTLYPLLAFIGWAIGSAVALRVMDTAALFHLVMLGLGLWFFNLSNVLFGAQTFAGCLDSSAFIAATVLGGRLLLGNNLAPLPVDGESSAVVENP